MSLFYSSEKWLMITFASVAITIGLVLQYAHGQEENTITIHPRSMEELKMIQQYCFDHADKILNGKNPINDLIATGLIELSEYLGTTCDEIPDYIEQAQDQLMYKRQIKCNLD